MLLSEFSQEFDINPSPRKIIFNYCELIHVSGDIFNAGKNVEDRDDYGFTGPFFKKNFIYITIQKYNL